MEPTALHRAVLLLANEALMRLESQLEASTYRTPGRKAWLDEQHAELKRLIDELSPKGFGA